MFIYSPLSLFPFLSCLFSSCPFLFLCTLFTFLQLLIWWTRRDSWTIIAIYFTLFLLSASTLIGFLVIERMPCTISTISKFRSFNCTIWSCTALIWLSINRTTSTRSGQGIIVRWSVNSRLVAVAITLITGTLCGIPLLSGCSCWNK